MNLGMHERNGNTDVKSRHVEQQRKERVNWKALTLEKSLKSVAVSVLKTGQVFKPRLICELAQTYHEKQVLISAPAQSELKKLYLSPLASCSMSIQPAFLIHEFLLFHMVIQIKTTLFNLPYYQIWPLSK